MAGAGKRTFIAGEVLTAAQVNDYLMDQAVMRFSGSAARAASITAPTEGMVTYLDDANRLEIYDGSAWQRVAMQSEDLRNLITDFGQVLVGAGSGSLIAIGGASDGQVLTAASAQPGGLQWVTPSGAGAAVFKNIAATGVTALPGTLTPGFYRISTGNTTTWTQAQFRFVDQYGNFYGASISSGTGFTTIPVSVASVNITTGAGFNLLVEELPGVTATLPNAPSVTDFGWTEVTGGSIAYSSDITPQRVGYFQTNTGSFFTSSVVTSPFTAASFVSSSTSLGADSRFVFVQQNNDGLWSTAASIYAASAFDSLYPFQVFTANGTYTPPVWSASADVYIVSGGGAGGGSNSDSNKGGGGGAGGASLFTNVTTSGSVAVTIGAGGAGGLSRGGNGTSSSFGAFSTTGGGGGGGTGAVNGANGGSGGGGSTPGGTGGTGVSGQGFAGGAATPFGGGGGGITEVGNTDGNSFGGDGILQWGIGHGGGGGGNQGDPASNGGDFGGANGGPAYGAGGAATPNSGGGGGGSQQNFFGPVPYAGGAGGSGRVIVKALP